MSEVQLPAQTKSKIDYDLLPYETDGIKISHRCVLCKAWASSARVDALEVDLQKSGNKHLQIWFLQAD